MNDQLILEECLTSDEFSWKVHNCKLSQMICKPNSTMTLLEHYQGLPESLKDTKLNFDVLKRMNEVMTISTVAKLLELDERHFRQSFAIKYVGRVVIFCELLQIAIRVHFSNTSKPYQTVFLPTKHQAMTQELALWRAFGVVDVLYKGNLELISLDGNRQVHHIIAEPAYRSLPSEHSLSVLCVLNDCRGHFTFLDKAINSQVMGHFDL